MTAEKRFYREDELADLARNVRKAAGKTQKEVAHDLRVAQASISQAESSPDRSLYLLRKRIIERYSGFLLVGPEFRLVPRSQPKRKTG